MNIINLNPDLELFVILAILGFLAVVIGSVLEKIIFLPAWLCGWAIGLTIIAIIALFLLITKRVSL